MSTHAINKQLFKLILLLLFGFISRADSAADDNLPNIGSSASRLLSLSKEQAVGDDYMRQLRDRVPILNDAEINDYIQHLGFKLVEHNVNAYNRKFSFFVIKNNTINAFAMPGGYIALYTGMITRTENESELASVISHEIAHVTQRHLARRLEKQKELALPTLAAYLAAILVATQAETAETSIGAISSVQGLLQQSLLNYSRANESEADRIGLTTLYDAGYDPHAAISFFEKMQQNQRYHSNAYEFLRTHPLSRTRITDARLRIRDFPQRKVVDPLIYHLMKAKIKALTLATDTVTLDQLKETYQKDQHKTVAEQYGFAIYMIRAGEYSVAEKILDQLYAKDAGQPSYTLALAELDIQRDTAKNSIANVEKMLKKSPGNLALVETLGKLYISNKSYAQARELLLRNIHMTTHAPYLLKLLSTAQENSGHMAEAYETRGNYLLAMGNIQGAMEQYEKALNSRTDDPYARQRINAILNDIDQVIKTRNSAQGK